MEYLELLGSHAKSAATIMNRLGQTTKNQALSACADALEANSEVILQENAKDIENAIANQMKESLVDRLSLTKARIKGMACLLYTSDAADD